MIIAIDASRYGHSQATGTERYSFEIINRVYALAKAEGHEVRMYVKEYLPNFPEEVQYPIRLKFLWTLCGLSLKMLLNKPDVLFVPAHVLPLIRAKKNVVMIHDIAFARYPKIYTWWQRKYLNWSTKYAVKHADRILVPSQFTSDDLKAAFHCPCEKIEVIRHGVNEFPTYTPADKTDCFKKFELHPSDKYMFFVGRIEQKKNVARIIKAFSSMANKGWKLVLGGKPGYGYEKIRELAKKSDASDRIVFTGYISEIEKTILLKNASMFLFPSIYEGFGMPVLEAFRAHVPVIASGIPALYEIGGTACYFVDPLSEEDITMAIFELIRDPLMRKRMVEFGNKQLGKFSWDKSAEKTWAALQH
ncbi:MAG: glycosyl transferase group 1 [uncultured bacterium]|nr:MAG: glycosyl transferase group 1 [uncultured bacterium]OGJ47859.1 MAG: hypothetical protein A2244_05265 [Candidatus Peregrinibacteria bacterium RIFOXYA2_FULL_41_18]OGJ48917.1 MAG: hypothetical protein A2344_02785 [Candidatus Peregrinibacteria bacterium RIFOXYB12_FULL_41_12]OGJ55273.1 MAG: hypothetical protein A2336_01780 [Candidatus Peregrinibacteria bacterium RIFOXYB2_FULL_41_88]